MLFMKTINGRDLGRMMKMRRKSLWGRGIVVEGAMMLMVVGEWIHRHTKAKLGEGNTEQKSRKEPGQVSQVGVKTRRKRSGQEEEDKKMMMMRKRRRGRINPKSEGSEEVGILLGTDGSYDEQVE